eukprot:4144639-Pleurochrysis_carterae.AAC.2
MHKTGFARAYLRQRWRILTFSARLRPFSSTFIAVYVPYPHDACFYYSSVLYVAALCGTLACATACKLLWVGRAGRYCPLACRLLLLEIVFGNKRCTGCSTISSGLHADTLAAAENGVYYGGSMPWELT